MKQKLGVRLIGSHELCTQMIGTQVPACHVSCCVSLGKSVPCHDPHFPHLKSELVKSALPPSCYKDQVRWCTDTWKPFLQSMKLHTVLQSVTDWELTSVWYSIVPVIVLGPRWTPRSSEDSAEEQAWLSLATFTGPISEVLFLLGLGLPPSTPTILVLIPKAFCQPSEFLLTKMG